jgi:hypothetical protein
MNSTGRGNIGLARACFVYCDVGSCPGSERGSFLAVSELLKEPEGIDVEQQVETRCKFYLMSCTEDSLL